METQKTFEVSMLLVIGDVMAKAIMESEASTRERVFEVAKRWLFREGYQALNMDQLARDLGMSKKTIYVHFSGKEELVAELVDAFGEEIKVMVDEVFSDPSLSYTQKLTHFTRELSWRFANLPPGFFRDLQRYAPRVYRHMEELRYRNIPIVFGRLVREGQEAGMVRPSVNSALAMEYWRHAIQGLMHPDTAERLKLRPDQIFNQALNLFCGGLLTPAGLHDYEEQATE